MPSWKRDNYHSRSSSNAECDQLLPCQPELCRFDDVLSKHSFQFHIHEKQVSTGFLGKVETLLTLPIFREWIFGEAYCTINNFIAYMSVSVSVFSLVAIAMDRWVILLFFVAQYSKSEGHQETITKVDTNSILRNNIALQVHSHCSAPQTAYFQSDRFHPDHHHLGGQWDPGHTRCPVLQNLDFRVSTSSLKGNISKNILSWSFFIV